MEDSASKLSGSIGVPTPKRGDINKGVQIIMNGSDEEADIEMNHPQGFQQQYFKNDINMIKPIKIEDNHAKSRPSSSVPNRPKSRTGESTPAPKDDQKRHNRPFSGMTN
jgi:hypothetical protein